MRFASPHMFWLFWLLPLLAGFFLYAFRKKSKTLARFAQVEMLKRMTDGISRGRQVSRPCCCCWWLLLRAGPGAAAVRDQDGTDAPQRA